ncbi:hypothetical protein ZOSMA_6G00310 [Zostera marina]|uniref:EF-hand domain-containing protein n=1 Tax=Zostera marina TaxID=29655 RepID=A0A0K9NR97_ZOSMR|nr:hypothetical protein ZOSMA_6G00310 [Zostera marina]
MDRKIRLLGLSINLDQSMGFIGSFLTKAKSTTKIIRWRRNPSPRIVLVTKTDEITDHRFLQSSSSNGSRRNIRLPRTVLEHFLFRLGVGESESSQVAEVVAEAGCDEEGKINLDDFLRPEISEEEELKQAFGMYDVNGDGVISPEELLRVLLTLEDNSCSINDCRRMIAVVDSDGDGFICFSDFKRMMSVG